MLKRIILTAEFENIRINLSIKNNQIILMNL